MSVEGGQALAAADVDLEGDLDLAMAAAVAALQLLSATWRRQAAVIPWMVLVAGALADQALNAVVYRQGLLLGWLWAHCLTTAFLARELAVVLHYQPAEEA